MRVRTPMIAARDPDQLHKHRNGGEGDLPVLPAAVAAARRPVTATFGRPGFPAAVAVALMPVTVSKVTTTTYMMASLPGPLSAEALFKAAGERRAYPLAQ